MTEPFFEKHDYSTGVFAVGLSTIVCMMLGGGMAAFLLVLSFQELLGEFTSKELIFYVATLEVVLNFAIVIPNAMIIVRGQPRAAKINQVNVSVQFVCYLLFSVTYDHENKWFCLSFALFSFLAHWLMSSAKYRAFLAFYDTLRKEPDNFRQRFLKHSGNRK